MEDGLRGAVQEAKSVISKVQREKGLQHDVGSVDVLALINCTGLSARKFVSPEEVEKIYLIRGQTLLLKGEAKFGRTYIHIPNTDDDEVLCIIPRSGSGTTILGGCKQARNWNGEVYESLSERILQRAKRKGLAEELRTGKGGEFEVISARVGLRPGREGGTEGGG